MFMLFSLACFAQVGVGTTTPNGALDVTSANDGMLIPRVSLAATNVATVATPTVSELVYNTNTSAAGPNQVTPGFYYWDGALWVRLLNTQTNDWSVTGNAGTTLGTNFLGTTDNVGIDFRTNNLFAATIGNTGRIGLGSVDQTWAQTFSLSGTNTIDALVGYSGVDGGTGVYGRSQGANGFGVWGANNNANGVAVYASNTSNGFGVYGTAANAGGLGVLGDGNGAGSTGVQGQADNATGVGVVGINTANGAIGIFGQTPGGGGNTVSAFSIYGTMDHTGAGGSENVAGVLGVTSTPRTGSGYSSPLAAATASAVSGVSGVYASPFTNANTEIYSFGVVGQTLRDTGVAGSTIPQRTGGVMGESGSGSFGILGYRDSNGTQFSVYGGGAAGSIAGGNGGRMSSNENSTPNNMIGLGINAGFMGGYVVGSEYGLVSKGKEFGIYVSGKTITNEPIVELVENNGVKTPTYATTSTSIDVTSRGKGKLNNGETFVAFDKGFASMVKANDDLNIIITPTGATNGVYVSHITSNGFYVKENMNGTSNSGFSWMATGTKAGYENGIEISSEILAADFDKKMEGVMINDGNEKEGTPIYFDGQNVKFERIPENLIHYSGTDDLKKLKPTEKEIKVEDKEERKVVTSREEKTEEN